MSVSIDRQSMVELAELVSKAVVNALKDSGTVGNCGNGGMGGSGTPQSVKAKTEKTAYQKTEQLLFNYLGFKRIVAERQQEIADLRRFGVPGKSAMSGGERVQTSRTNVGIVLPEDAVEDAVRQIERSFAEVNKAINLIDSALDKIQNEPYAKIIPLFYFNGCTLEDIGVQFGCDHSTISRNKSKLVKALSLWLFPNDTVKEYFG